MNTNRTATWANIGTDVTSCNNNLDCILKNAGLDYTVESKPVIVDGNVVENFHAIVRSDGKVYNIPKKSYNVCQNKDAFSVVNEFGDKVKVVKAGESENGMIYLIGALDTIKVLDDEFTPYVILQNSHNADFALKSAIVPLRIVCQNQFNIAFGKAANTFTVKHTASINSRISEMNQIMNTAVNYLNDFSKNAQVLATKKIDFTKFLDAIKPITAEMTDRKVNTTEIERYTIQKAYESDDNANFKGTAWGALNAAMDYDTHRKSRTSQEQRFVSSIIYPEFPKLVMKTLQSL